MTGSRRASGILGIFDVARRRSPFRERGDDPLAIRHYACVGTDSGQPSPVSWWRFARSDTGAIDDRAYRIHLGVSAVGAALVSLIWFAIGGWLLAVFTFVIWFAMLAWKGKRAHDRYVA